MFADAFVKVHAFSFWIADHLKMIYVPCVLQRKQISCISGLAALMIPDRMKHASVFVEGIIQMQHIYHFVVAYMESKHNTVHCYLVFSDTTGYLN